MTLPANSWIKYLPDSSLDEEFNIIVGTDQEIEAGKVSWRKGQFNNLKAVSISTEKMKALIIGNGTYWQADEYLTNLSNGDSNSTRTKRKIRKKLAETDVFVLIEREPRSLTLHVTDSVGAHKGEFYLLHPGDIGKWLVAEIDCVKNQFSWYIHDNK